MDQLRGQSALVTGAGRGFGKAIAVALAGAGASVTVTARRSSEIEAVRAQIVQAGGFAQAVRGDARESPTVQRIYRAHVAAFGAPDILVNCAGVGDPIGPVGYVDVDSWWQVLQIHLFASMAFMSSAVPDMQIKGRGCIINVASLVGNLVLPAQSAYCVAKAAMLRLTEHVAAENRHSGIAVFAVHPGFVITEMAEKVIDSPAARRWVPEFAAMFEERRARGGGTEDLARCSERCIALASGRYNHLTGKFLDFNKELPA